MDTNLVQIVVPSEKEVFERGFTDFQYFAKLCLPDIMIFELPEYYISIWIMLLKARTAEERAKIIRFALGLPRGFIKTTFMKILIVWFIVYDYEDFVLIVCADEPLSHNVLMDIDNILGSSNIEKIYGKWTVNKAIDNKEQKTARYRSRNIILVAVGINSNIRGVNIENRRPGIIFFDDAQPESSARSDIEYNKIKDRFVGTFLKLVNPIHAMVIYVGNMYIGDCILKELKENDGWISLITGCILETGDSLWPALHKLKDMHSEYRHDAQMGRAHIWFAEKMNDPISERTSLLPEGKLPDFPLGPNDQDRAEGGFVTIDPAGLKLVSDDNVILANLIYDDKPVVVDGEGGILDPEQVVKAACNFCIKYNIAVVCVEAAGYQGTLAFWANKYCRDNKLDWIIWVELSPKRTEKGLRIISWVKEVLSGSCGITGEARLKVLWQALSYKFNKQKNQDDWLDCAAKSLEVKNTPEYWDMAKTIIDRNNKDLALAQVVGGNTPF